MTNKALSSHRHIHSILLGYQLQMQDTNDAEANGDTNSVTLKLYKTMYTLVFIHFQLLIIFLFFCRLRKVNNNNLLLPESLNIPLGFSLYVFLVFWGEFSSLSSSLVDDVLSHS